MAQLTGSLALRPRESPRRFRVILRGDDFLVASGRTGFYVVRTVTAENETLAGKLALFDFTAELRIAERLERRFLENGSLRVEEAHLLEDGEEDVASSFLFYPMA